MLKRTMRAAAFALPLLAASAFPYAAQAADVALQTAPSDGWASQSGGTLGGSAAISSNIFTVSNRVQLLNAIANGGSQPKIIKIVGVIDMSEGVAFSSHADQATRAAITLPSNTTLIGDGTNSGIVNGYLSLAGISQAIIRNLKIVAPCDVAPVWDASGGTWSGSFPAISVSASNHVWIDHNSVTDSPVTNDTLPIQNGAVKECHDSALDIVSASDYITVSYNQISLHGKGSTVGASDTATTDDGYLRVTFSNNVFSNISMRAPRVRFGKVHLFNNYFVGSKTHPVYAHGYSVGAGVSAKILSNSNSFEITGASACDDVITNPNSATGAGAFKDIGSIFNGNALAGCVLSGSVSWSVPYAFSPRAASLVKLYALLNAGGGKLTTTITGTGNTSSSSSSAASSTSSSVSSSSLPLVMTVSGWASQGAGTVGGTYAPASNIYTVHNRAELNNALRNANSPTYASNPATALAEPKIIYVVGSIWGTDLGNGTFADEAYYKSTNTTAAKWDWNLYIQSLDNTFNTTLNAAVAAGDPNAIATKAAISALSSARTTLSNIQKAQIQFIIPSNTSILGVGADAKIIDGYFSINATSNIIIRNLEFQAPLDLTTTYDTSKQEWNARFKAISVVTGKQLWFDHCTLTDGTHLDTEMLTINGYTLPVMRHDGLLDIEDSSDYVTISYTLFKNHDKTNMVGGSGDGNGYKERDYNRITFSNNIWDSSVQRAPRARFGQIHVYNNYYTGSTDDSVYPVAYYIGMGAESRILSEGNAFYMTGSKAKVSRVMSNLNGYQFKDVGSWYNGIAASADLEAAASAALTARYSSAVSAGAASSFTVAPYTNVLGWTPPYSYTLGASAEDVRQHNLTNAGAGKITFDPTTPAVPASSSSSSSVASSSSSSAASSASSSSASSIGGSAVLTSTFASPGLPASVATSYDDSTGTYTMVSAGGFAGAGDTLQFAYTQVSGDFTIVANLKSMTIPSGVSTANVRAGLMIRNSLSATSRYYGVLLRGTPEMRWEQRVADLTSGVTGSAKIANVAMPSAAAPIKLKLQRTGQVITVSYSTDGGTSWLPSPAKTQDFASAAGAVAFDGTVYVGLVGVSGIATATSTAVFDGVTLSLP
jgi:pectate lyase